MNAVTITVPQSPPQANVLLRMHWAKRKREQQNWREWLHAEANVISTHCLRVLPQAVKCQYLKSLPA